MHSGWRAGIGSCLVRALGLLLLASAGSAQDDIDQRLLELLNERNREDMHPGNPLKLVGVEQEGNSFRDRTPALLNGDIVAALVDPEENRARRLAMYGSTSRLDRPQAVLGMLGTGVAARYQAPIPIEPGEQAEPAEENAEQASGWVLRLASGIGALLCLLAIKHRLS